MNMTQPKIVTISREKLYEKVWTISVTQLAKSYGISDVGLAKACKRHQIPRPPLGYWARKAVGKAPARPALPVLSDPDLQTVRFATGTSGPTNRDDWTTSHDRTPTFDSQDLKEAFERFRQLVPTVTVADQLGRTTGVIAATREGLQRATKTQRFGARNDQQNLFSPYSSDRSDGIDLLVGKESFIRVLLIWNALIIAFEKCGVVVRPIDEQYKRYTSIDAFGEQLRMRMRERTRRVPHEPTTEERAQQVKYPHMHNWYQWEYHPNGRLVLELSTADGVLRRSWEDRGKVKLEEKLWDVVTEVFVQVDRARVRRREQLAAEKRRALEARQEWEAQQRRQEEQHRVNELLKEVNEWETAVRIRRYVREVRRVMARRGQAIVHGSQMDKFLAWAEGVAKRIDPTPVDDKVQKL